MRYPELQHDQALLQQWRRDIHAHPELAFDEHRTARLVAGALHEAGIEVFAGIGGTGVVGRLQCGSSARAIGLRADMDALPMQEANAFAHRSRVDGVFHGCGHDGHTAMLLGAARQLARTRHFDGCVYFIFQPAEEGQGGAPAMIRDGLFERFPMRAVYGMHNSPEHPAGHFALRAGALLGAFEKFDITVRGTGGHGAFPHRAVDSLLVAAQITQALQAVVSRGVDPLQAAVLSVTRLHAGEAYNVIPAEARLGGAIRYLDPAVGDAMRARMSAIVDGVASAHGASAELHFHVLGYPPLINDEQCTTTAARVATDLVGAQAVATAIAPSMGSDDFAHLLQHRPGCYILIGNAGGPCGSTMVHNPEYDFNDAILTLGASFWVRLVETELC